ncbi:MULTISPECIES: lipoyl(octanoyl) transferase LipB [Alteromonadaceae]|uniref:lipoyl(octanoyl) transferase LipB n=1 Tax=Alteromonadaceae TaxID=72275 RepID=UPI001C0A3DAC|nr:MULTISPECIES: lipoyl(octanoyl) transferase LipB [Aliiglaciecola]MBU2876181.1 lipoyl(octanoyl) transferase LipB [Aliiglaciecola lipolytica]MDO6710397.1 lipoyl(octanoyl) transferase LipB [Aliiglaciecola sp. 2_MG-2023]MDO6751738.1 lipoyl(octanoyl) transferase LipB [Aliiglaciecola sp. 1_MG-2023]
MSLVVRQLGKQSYQPIWQAMQDFTDSRDATVADEIWLVEHLPVFTQGQAGKEEHLLAPGDIPVVKVDRGGQVTYHGPGQQTMYVLLDIKRRKLGVRNLVTALESCVVNTLQDYAINAYPKADAPGVYVDEKKVCSVGLRIRKGCSFHGLALNVNMDLSPFNRINPCGYAGLEMINCATIGGPQSVNAAGTKLVEHFCNLLNIDHKEYKEGFDE